MKLAKTSVLIKHSYIGAIEKFCRNNLKFPRKVKPAWLRQNLAFSTLWKEKSELELGPPPVASLGVISDRVAGSHPHPLGDRPRDKPSGETDIDLFSNQDLGALFTNQDTRTFIDKDTQTSVGLILNIAAFPAILQTRLHLFCFCFFANTFLIFRVLWDPIATSVGPR